jgi:hypothetical protein
MSRSVQLNLPPLEVQRLNQPVVNQAMASHVKPDINPLKWFREAAHLAECSQTYLASAVGVSEALLSAQLSGQQDKHLSLKRAAGIEDVDFWCYFALRILHGIGLYAVVMTAVQYEVHLSMVAAQVATAREAMQRRTA